MRLPLPRRQPRSAASATGQPRSAAYGLRKQSSAVAGNRKRISAVAERQWGVASWAQLRRRGLAEATIHRAIAAGRLHHVFGSVYSVVAPSLMTVEAWHAAAVLAGGPGACLCGWSAAWWTKLLKTAPSVIHVAVRSDLAKIDGIEWHRFDVVEPVKHNRMPVTPLARIPLDLAAGMSEWDLRGVLAELEFHHDIGPDAVRAALRRGKPGGAKLRRALDAHTPELAETRSELERTCARFLEECGFRMPDFNQPEGKSTVDAVYRDARIAIELDGVKGHSGERRVLRDHRRDLHRRADGFLPLRYHFAQFLDLTDRRLIEDELDRYGAPRI